MPEPILTLTTDFGLSDHYVGAMKGVILGICPQARIVDISHEVTPFEIAEGAYLIAQAYRCFPQKDGARGGGGSGRGHRRAGRFWWKPPGSISWRRITAFCR